MDNTENTGLHAKQQNTAAADVTETLTETANEFKSWLISAGIAVVVILAIVLYRGNKTSNEQKASRMLSEARNVQALQAIMNQYPGTSAAQLSLMQMSKAQYDNGDYIAAQASYKSFLAQYPSHPMAGIAELGLVQCTEGLGQTEQALSAYSSFAAKNPTHFLTPTAIFGKARCLQTLKRYKEARATYEDFLAAHPKSEWQNDVEESLKQLDREARTPSVKL